MAMLRARSPAAAHSPTSCTTTDAEPEASTPTSVTKAPPAFSISRLLSALLTLLIAVAHALLRMVRSQCVLSGVAGSDEVPLKGGEMEEVAVCVWRNGAQTSALVEKKHKSKEDEEEEAVRGGGEDVGFGAGGAPHQQSRILMNPSWIGGGQAERKLLALDLDETLIHATLQPQQPHDFAVHVRLTQPSAMTVRFHVFVRPHCREFLRIVSQWYRLCVFTAGQQEYADAVLEGLGAESNLLKTRYYRQHCVPHGDRGQFAKPLAKAESNLSQVMLVDNSPVCYALHPENGIPIETWQGNDSSDRELLHLLPLLESLRHVHDVRSVLRLRTHEVARSHLHHR